VSVDWLEVTGREDVGAIHQRLRILAEDRIVDRQKLEFDVSCDAHEKRATLDLGLLGEGEARGHAERARAIARLGCGAMP
jgi:hypothetical protein